MTRRKKVRPLPSARGPVLVLESPTVLKRGDVLWQPIVSSSPGAPDPAVNRITFSDREPADFIQIDFPGDGRVLTLVGTSTGPITPPTVKTSPMTHKRICRIRIEFPRKHVFDEVLAPWDGGPIRTIAAGIEVLPDRVIVENLYKRNRNSKELKVLNRLVMKDRRASVNIHAMLEGFDALFGVDTNIVTHPDGDVWITSLCSGHSNRLDAQNASVGWKHMATLTTPARGHAALAEKVGWLEAIEYLAAKGLVADSSACALVVDAHLANLEKYSERSLPLFGTTLLPSGWVLVYATSDAGTREFLPNAMLAGAHRNAKIIELRIKGRRFAELWPPKPEENRA